MDLLFIWLGEIKDRSKSFVFENQGFKFTSEFNIEFNKDNNELKIEKNNNFCEDFYKVNPDYKAPFKVTCVVGENGAGKTCLLEMLLSIYDKIALSHFDKSDYSYLVYVLKINNNLYIYKSPSKIKIISNLKYYSLKITKLKKLIKYSIIILYSNYISEHNLLNINMDKNTFFDISTQNLIEYDFKSFKNESNNIINMIQAFRLKEFFRKLNFLYNGIEYSFDKNKTLNKFRKRQLVIAPLNIFNEILFSDLRDYIENFNDEKYQYLFEQYINKLTGYAEYKIKDDNQRLLWSFAFILLNKVFNYYILKLNENNYEKDYVINTMKLSNKIDYKQKPLKYILSTIDDFVNIFIFKNKNSKIIFKSSLRKKIITYIKVISRLINNNLNNNEVKDYIEIPNNVSTETLKDIEEFLKIYNELKILLCNKNEEFIDIYLSPKFSNGENNILILLSRLYDLKLNNLNIIIENKHLMIFIDEAELGFHPQWCKKYIGTLISYIQSLFAEYNVPIHLIVTTNNPIILSDILPDDVIYLRNKNSLNEFERPKSAFGSNILDLYSDCFFIQDGLIGAFAKEKIRQVVQYIKHNSQESNNNSLITKEECEFIINNIGDSNIRAFLNGLFDEKVRKEGL